MKKRTVYIMGFKRMFLCILSVFLLANIVEKQLFAQKHFYDHRDTVNDSFKIKCPFCRKKIFVSSDSSLRVCNSCGAKNASEARFCSKCGDSLSHANLLLQCPKCASFFEQRNRRTRDENYCQYCEKSFPDSYQTCPYCAKKRRTSPPLVAHATGRVSIDSFTKADYKPLIRTFQIGSHTSRDFHKVLIQVRKKEQYTVIVNMIKIKSGGKWLEFGQGVRLNEGINEFPVSIPSSSTELLIAFDHGKGSVVSVSIE